MTEINKYLQGATAPITTNTETSENVGITLFPEGTGVVYRSEHARSHKYKEHLTMVPLKTKTEIIKSMLPDLVDLMCAIVMIVTLSVFRYVIMAPIDGFVRWFMNTPNNKRHEKLI